ncbi:MAG: trehalose-phosphatase [Allosphingosinicella sp.]|uniref:trehalose-phosphatase n=1 Tax=Allosphingosinicella sp. TaxID=2823234 RepID=UPI0039308D97
MALLDGAALFLDFDGTLIELAETPDSITVSADLPRLLERLRDQLHGRLALVSGRALSDLDRYLSISGIPFSGSHGLELRLGDGTLVPLHAPRGLDEVRERVRRFAADRGGLLVEDKPAGVALHFRLSPDAANSAIDFMERLARESDLVVQHGNMVAELRPAGADKGDAVRALMTEEPFKGARPVFVGDDLTDEHAFAAVADMGGAGVLVGPLRETAALYRLPSVAGVAEWLTECA